MNQRGITLVELMIVVVIIGVLASIASIAYGRYLKRAKVEKLQQYAMEVASGQERYRARNNQYWGGGAAKDYSVAADKPGFVNLLDFSRKVPDDVKLETVGWDGSGESCDGLCVGVPSDESVAGFAVRVSQDLDGQGPPNSTIAITHLTQNPVLLFEGQ